MEKVKIFLDTNIVIDYYSARQCDGIAQMIIQIGDTPHYELCISMLTAVNILYCSKRYNYVLKPADLSERFRIIGMTETEWANAQKLPISDFEDSLQCACAISYGCRAIITRDGHFKESPLITFSPEQFIREITT